MDKKRSNFIYSFLFNPSYRLLLNYRISKKLYDSKFIIFKLVAFYLKNQLYLKRSCQISLNATLEEGVFFPHPINIVIGDNTIVGKNTTIWQGVTLGSHGHNAQKKSYPIIGENVKIFAGAKIIGNIKIGDGALIGANAVVLKDVPAFHTAVGVPARIFKNK
ncbi:serine O-acetyltransferase [Flammeovirga aprica]|uniref:Serine acetyltransferase n=1 Tax=Flammeovirga aprica JL-4 TaxID=694437 RepID=A0A7X9S0N8_9BACT|nr:serine O-acetyltransferase [Flammeovirga aprica]NME72226.1 serine acetyltransferase [Flammeovirga aprica JL-4]